MSRQIPRRVKESTEMEVYKIPGNGWHRAFTSHQQPIISFSRARPRHRRAYSFSGKSSRIVQKTKCRRPENNFLDGDLINDWVKKRLSFREQNLSLLQLLHRLGGLVPVAVASHRRPCGRRLRRFHLAHLHFTCQLESRHHILERLRHLFQ